MPFQRARHIVWSIAIPLGIAVVVAAAQLALFAESGPTPPFLHRRGTRLVSTELAREALGEGVHVAGSGSGMVLCRALARAFEERDPTIRIVVHESIGSTGGIRAAYDGLVDLGVITRPLRSSESELGLRTIPIARVAVAVIAHPEVRDAGLATEQLLAIYRGEWSRWSDGTPVVALLRERGDSSHDAIARAFPPFRAVNDAAIESRRFRVLYHDDDLVRAVLAIRGAIGISDVAVVRTHTPSPRILSVDGQAPGPEAVRDGRYPFVKPVAFVTRGELSPAARRFVEFARSDEGARVLESLGAVPGGEDGGP